MYQAIKVKHSKQFTTMDTTKELGARLNLQYANEATAEKFVNDLISKYKLTASFWVGTHAGWNSEFKVVRYGRAVEVTSLWMTEEELKAL